jgi:hypothetical protein
MIAISQTVKTRQKLIDLNEKLSQVETAPETIATLEKRLSDINSKIGENYNNTPEFQKNLLDQISEYCAKFGLVLREFPQVHNWKKQDYEFITGYAKIEGPFIPLLKLLYELESSHAFGRIVSVDYFSYEDRRAKKLRLTMSIYVQTIKQTSNANTE